jgi:hypothetical protein
VCMVLAWRDRRASGGAASRAPPIRPVRVTSKTGVGLGAGHFVFRARDDT